MKISLIAFGQIKDMIGYAQTVLEDIYDTNSLGDYLLKLYPAMQFVNYAVAVNEEIVSVNTTLEDGATVAILPPFSGG